MATPNWLRYANQGATRSQPLNPQLVSALGFLPELGVEMEVFSGGQPSSGPNRVGSHRHDHGNAGDVFFHKDGKRLDWANPADRPVFEEVVRRGKAAGVTGFGAGPGYMQAGSMHLGFGSPSVWGAGGSGSNAPDWLRSAFNGAPAGKVGGDGMVPRDHSSQVAAQTNTPVFGSMSPGGFQPPSGIDPSVAQYAFAEDKKPLGERMQAAGQMFSQAMPGAAPRPGAFPGGPSAEQSNGLLKVMQNPQALAQMLMSRRI